MYTHTCLCICICICMCIHISHIAYINTSLSLYIYIYTYVMIRYALQKSRSPRRPPLFLQRRRRCITLHAPYTVYTPTNICIHIYIYICIAYVYQITNSLSICIYVYIYIYIYVYTHSPTRGIARAAALLDDRLHHVQDDQDQAATIRRGDDLPEIDISLIRLYYSGL